MPDREKVIEGLEHCSSSDGCNGCPYSKSENGHVCSFNCIRDTLELLKEQEPTRVESVCYGTDMFKRYRCQTCKAFFDHKYNYCPNCGRKVRWDG